MIGSSNGSRFSKLQMTTQSKREILESQIPCCRKNVGAGALGLHIMQSITIGKPVVDKFPKGVVITWEGSPFIYNSLPLTLSFFCFLTFFLFIYLSVSLLYLFFCFPLSLCLYNYPSIYLLPPTDFSSPSRRSFRLSAYLLKGYQFLPDAFPCKIGANFPKPV